MINLNPLFVPTTVLAAKAGTGTYKEEEIDILGDSLQEFINSKRFCR